MVIMIKYPGIYFCFNNVSSSIFPVQIYWDSRNGNREAIDLVSIFFREFRALHNIKHKKLTEDKNWSLDKYLSFLWDRLEHREMEFML